MKNITVIALAFAGISNAAWAQDTIHWGTASIWGGGFKFEPGQSDAYEDDRIYGLGLGYGTDLGNGILGYVDAEIENSSNIRTDNDQTIARDELSFQLVKEIDNLAIGGFFGLGQSHDNGDNGGHILYRYGGLAAKGSFDRFSLEARAGVMSSKDNFGESIDKGTFFGASLSYDVMDNLRIGGGFNQLNGDRFNSTVPNSNKIVINEAVLRVEYDLTDAPFSMWVEGVRSDYNATGESDDPWVNEFRIGLTYNFGGKHSKRTKFTKPNVGRWVSVSANEIE